MSDEVFAWTAASNNQAFLAGRLSMALNAISIVRSAEDSGNQALSDDTWLASIPRGPAHAARQRARDGRLPDLEVREEQGGGAEVRRRPAARLPRALRSQQVLQLPAVDGRDQGRLQDDPHSSRRRTRTSRRASTRSSRRSPRSTRRTPATRATRRRSWTRSTTRSSSRRCSPRSRRASRRPAEAVSAFAKKAQGIYRKWHNQKLV